MAADSGAAATVALRPALSPAPAEVAGLWAALARVGALDPESESPRERQAVVLELASVLDRVKALLVRWLGASDAAGDHRLDGALSSQAWLAHRSPLRTRDAGRVVRAGRFVQHHPRTADALAEGQISVGHVEALTRATANGREERYPACEEMLLTVAAASEVDAFDRAATTWRHAVDDELGLGEPAQAFARRYLTLSPTFGGMVVVDGLLDPEGGAALMAAVDAAEPPDPADRVGGPRSPGQRRADALADLARSFLANRPTKGGRPTTAVDVVVDVKTLEGRHDGTIEGRRCEIPRVGPIPPETARRLTCSAVLTRVLTAGSEVLDLGKPVHPFTPAQRRALLNASPTCAFDGCDRPGAWADIHHLEPLAEGGLTDLDNGVVVCRPHHVLLHEGGWRLRREPDGRLVAVPPTRRGRSP